MRTGHYIHFDYLRYVKCIYKKIGFTFYITPIYLTPEGQLDTAIMPATIYIYLFANNTCIISYLRLFVKFIFSQKIINLTLFSFPNNL